MIKYQSRIINNWLQSSWVCEQRHMLRMLGFPREILCFPGWEALGDQWHGMASVSHTSAAH